MPVTSSKIFYGVHVSHMGHGESPANATTQRASGTMASTPELATYVGTSRPASAAAGAPAPAPAHPSNIGKTSRQAHKIFETLRAAAMRNQGIEVAAALPLLENLSQTQALACVRQRDAQGWQLLHYFANCLSGPVEAFERLVAAGADLDSKVEDGITPVMLAAGASRPLCRHLGGYVDLTRAAYARARISRDFLKSDDIVEPHFAQIRQLKIESEANRARAARSVATTDNYEVVAWFVEHGIDVRQCASVPRASDGIDAGGFAYFDCLDLAMMCCRYETVRYLLQLDIYAQDLARLESAVDVACALHYLDNGKDVQVQSRAILRRSSETWVNCCGTESSGAIAVRIVQKLVQTRQGDLLDLWVHQLASGAYPSARRWVRHQDPHGRTMLHAIVGFRPDAASVGLLLELGAAADIADGEGVTPLHAACGLNAASATLLQLIAFAQMLDTPASDMAPDHRQFRPAMVAKAAALRQQRAAQLPLATASLTVVKMLLEAGADPTRVVRPFFAGVVDNFVIDLSAAITPLFLAAFCKQPSIIAHLLNLEEVRSNREQLHRVRWLMQKLGLNTPRDRALQAQLKSLAGVDHLPTTELRW